MPCRHRIADVVVPRVALSNGERQGKRDKRMPGRFFILYWVDKVGDVRHGKR